MSFTLHTSITELRGISDQYSRKLSKMQIDTFGDLLTHFPRYHKDTRALTDLGDITSEGVYTVRVQILGLKNIKLPKHRSLQVATLSDATATLEASWFNQPFLIKSINERDEYLLTGKAKIYRGKLKFFPDNWEVYSADSTHLGRLAPQYPLTAGVSAKWLRTKLKNLIDILQQITIPDELAEDDTQLKKALTNIHFPADPNSLEFAYNYLSMLELINLALRNIKGKRKQNYAAHSIGSSPEAIKQFIANLHFDPTADQLKALAEIQQDLAKEVPMFRLLQGDVGSGKTLVAMLSALAVAQAGYQTVVLAPTTVLAEQHYAKFTEYFADFPEIQIILATNYTKSDKPGEIVIGTSAVLARKQKLIVSPGLVIVDEQHRFGVTQREELLKPFQDKLKFTPHILDMTATPIPRTLALAIYDDLQVSTISHKPQGRLPIFTRIVPNEKREAAYSWIREYINTDQVQVYWITPNIEESANLEVAAAKNTFLELQTIYPDLKVGLLHGKLKEQEKSDLMHRFNQGEINILVSTSVIEVGIDVPNAAVMVIENPERFGMAQLHQLRGRVGRGQKQSWCFLFPGEEITEEAEQRLEFFCDHSDGLEIAEYDLKRRGPGEVYGTKQAGIPNLKIAKLDDLEKLKTAKSLAQKLSKQGVKSISLFNLK